MDERKYDWACRGKSAEAAVWGAGARERDGGMVLGHACWPPTEFLDDGDGLLQHAALLCAVRMFVRHDGGGGHQVRGRRGPAFSTVKRAAELEGVSSLIIFPDTKPSSVRHVRRWPPQWRQRAGQEVCGGGGQVGETGSAASCRAGQTIGADRALRLAAHRAEAKHFLRVPPVWQCAQAGLVEKGQKRSRWRPVRGPQNLRTGQQHIVQPREKPAYGPREQLRRCARGTCTRCNFWRATSRRARARRSRWWQRRACRTTAAAGCEAPKARRFTVCGSRGNRSRC